jgi:hypothetical protein
MSKESRARQDINRKQAYDESKYYANISNKEIAVKWAKNNDKFAFSDEFFKPFTKLEERLEIVKDLESHDVIVWPIYTHGALLVKMNDSRLCFSEVQDGNKVFRSGAYHFTESDQVLMLPPYELETLQQVG